LKRRGGNLQLVDSAESVRHGVDAHHHQHLGQRLPVRLDVVRPPQHHRHRFWPSTAVLRLLSLQQPGKSTSLVSTPINSHTVDSPQIGHAPDPEKPVALRICPVSGPQEFWYCTLQIGQSSYSRTQVPIDRTICPLGRTRFGMLHAEFRFTPDI